MGIARWIATGLGIAAIGAVAAYAQYRDIEKPAYEIVIDDDGFELRDYQPMVVAEVTHTGSRRQAQGASFRRLAAYIFGQDRPAGGEEIPMTSPVITEKVDQNQEIAMTSPVMTENTGGDSWRMRFVMPAKYTLETLPAAPQDITLTQVPGIGTWTAEIYAMFSLGRADVFAPGDLALQEAARILFDLPARPKDGALRRMARDWSPWRSVAARLLFAYYRLAKQRDGIG